MNENAEYVRPGWLGEKDPLDSLDYGKNDGPGLAKSPTKAGDLGAPMNWKTWAPGTVANYAGSNNDGLTNAQARQLVAEGKWSYAGKTWDWIKARFAALAEFIAKLAGAFGATYITAQFVQWALLLLGLGWILLHPEYIGKVRQALGV